MEKVKVMNYKMEEEYHEALEVVREHYSRTSGVKLTKVQALKRLLWEASMQVKNTGTLFEKGGSSASWEE